MKRLLSIVFLIVLSAACQKPHVHPTGKPRVVTSIPPYIYIVNEIVGDTMEVSCALGDNFNLHTSEVTPKHLKATKGVDLFVGVGEAYEKRLISAVNQGETKTLFLNLNKKIPLLQFSQSTSFIDACHDAKSHIHHSEDLHFWLGPQSLIKQIPILVQNLAMISPENGELYKKNGDLLIERIRVLNNELKIPLTPYKGRAIIVSHPALGYFCEEYDIKQISVECEGKDPLPKDISHIVHHAESSSAICVFISPHFNNKGAELIAKKLNLRVEVFNPLAENPLETIIEVSKAILKEVP